MRNDESAQPRPTCACAGPDVEGPDVDGPGVEGSGGDREAPPGAGLSRRTALRGAAVLGATGLLTAVSEGASTRYAFAAGATEARRDTLVVLSLRGGFDGLSAVVPAADKHYYALRPTIAIPASRLFTLDRRFGLHPSLKALQPFWRDRRLAFVHAVGQADPTRSHFEAMAEMERAAPGTSLRTGWLDRTLGLRPRGTAFRATQVGSAVPGGAFTGPAPELVLPSIAEFTLSGTWDAATLTEMKTAMATLHQGAPSALARPAASALSAVSTTSALAHRAYHPAHGAHYPASDLGSALRDVARLIKAGVGLQVAAIDVGDWDMHADLGTASKGWMHDHLKDLGDSIAAFATDLGRAAMGNVTLLTLSEFGRRVEENGSGGVDHGHGNAVMLLGGGVNGGKVYGRWPGLSARALVDGDLAGTTDYRLILREVLADRCRQPGLATVFPHLRGKNLGLTKAR